jgi:hypothetical protein
MGAVCQGQAAVHPGLTQGLAGQHRRNHVGPLPTVLRGKVKPQQTEFPHFAKRFEIEGLFEVMLLHPGDDLLFGEPDDLFLEHELLSGKCKIHGLFSFPPTGGSPFGARRNWRLS